MGEKTCKVYTPPEIVDYMLDKIGYTEQLYGKKILENSCGTGRFLCEIVRRYIADGRKNNRTEDEIRAGLSRDIHGIEKEKEACRECRDNLDDIAAAFGIRDVEWNVRQADALKFTYESEYQFVVGNPPYITYYNMELADREIIRTNFAVCKKGKADYYYAFTEAALKALAADGIMAYLIPNNFMKNRYSEELRKYILPYLLELEDFKFEKIFENYQTSSAIIICAKQNQRDTFIYRDREIHKEVEILKSQLKGKWTFDSFPMGQQRKKRFGDCFKVSAPVATLLNEAFIIKSFIEEDTWIETAGFKLEKSGLRLAASPKSKQNQEKNYIIFPYYYRDGAYCRYTEEQFVGMFPQIAGYLKQYMDKLQKRNVDKKSQWFEYGRSQALTHINQEKIMLSTLITGKVKYYLLEKETVPYSGMYIVPKGNYTMKQAEEILSSKAFFEYVTNVGIHANGKTYRISPNDVENYMFEEKEGYAAD